MAIKTGLKNLLRKTGYSLIRNEHLGQGAPDFIPFVRDIHCGRTAYRMWIANKDAEAWYSDAELNRSVETAELARLVTPKSRILEFGPHHGSYTLMLAGHVAPGGIVVAVEPEPQTAMICQAQVALNEWGHHVHVLHAAGAAQAGQTIRMNLHHCGSVLDGQQSGGVEVPTVSGDALDERYGPFDFLKIDVEGFELEVLKGCRSLLRRRPVIALELHTALLPRYGATVEDIFGMVDIGRYHGSMMFSASCDKLHPFDAQMAKNSPNVNLFLW